MRFGDDDLADDLEGLTVAERDLAAPTRPRKSRQQPPPGGEPPEAKRKHFRDNFKLRPLQQAIRNDNHRFKTACVHRRFGKTVLAVDWLDDGCRNIELEYPRCYYIAPTYRAAKRIAWDMVKMLTSDIKVKYNDYELSVDYPNGARLQLLGATEFQRHRGIYGDRVVMDELSHMPPGAWREVFRPALADRKGSAMFIGTPMGRDYFWELYQNAERLDDWASWHYTALETGVIDPEEMAALQAEMNPRDWKREFMCDWDVGYDGAYFAKELAWLFDEKRIGEVPWIADKPVHTGWHMGKTDSVVVTFWQQDGANLHLIDSIWQQQTAVDELVRELQQKPYVYGTHLAPEAINVDHPASRRRQLRELGLRLQFAPNMEHMDAVYATKPVLRRSFIDREKNLDVVEALRQHRADYDVDTKTYSQTPVADWTAQVAGSVMTYATGRPQRGNWDVPLVYPGDANAA